ncbi:hypothetical protein O6H91_11G087000 [Diphasiastrum complanatum]|uniref:Uncharacterized protein n=1 Tax=Diphasiastrum complanatum TaxID=34168 RepID=A0ACC2CBH9_DIPCM|nr:hypothetical protein O6H91_11G087000 [Diphasiastrum complanatum]
MNRAIVQRAFGGEPLDVLELVEKEKPKASAGHVVVKLTARSIIPYDFVCIRQADLECFRDQQPVTGIDGCGIVDEVGEGVTKYKIGDRVIPILLWKYLYGKGQGSWQDYIEVAEDDIIPCPETIPDEVAAQLLMTECALYGSFMDLEIPQGEWFLQTAANSNFGRQIIQLAKHRGIKTINIVRRDNVIEALKALGADEVINFTKEDVISKVKEITGGKGVYAAHDAIAGTLSKAISSFLSSLIEFIIYHLNFPQFIRYGKHYF